MHKAQTINSDNVVVVVVVVVIWLSELRAGDDLWQMEPYACVGSRTMLSLI